MRTMYKLDLVALSALVAVISAACSEHAAKTAERSVSPLIGTWVRDGNTPKPDTKSPQFTRLTFTPDGSLSAKYVAAGGALAGVIDKGPKVMSETDTYSTTGSSVLG